MATRCNGASKRVSYLQGEETTTNTATTLSVKKDRPFRNLPTCHSVFQQNKGSLTSWGFKEMLPMSLRKFHECLVGTPNHQAVPSWLPPLTVLVGPGQARWGIALLQAGEPMSLRKTADIVLFTLNNWAMLMNLEIWNMILKLAMECTSGLVWAIGKD